MSVDRRHVLVLGGTGAIGRAVLEGLARRKVLASFTYLASAERAHALTEAYQNLGIRIDLAGARCADELFAALDAAGIRPDVLVHAAAIAPKTGAATADGFDEAVRVSGRSGLLIAEALAARLAEEDRPGHVVFVGMIERTQSLPLPPAFAAAQGMLAPMAMAMAKELGPRVRVNLVAGGLISAGVSATVTPEQVGDFEKLSALRRVGTADEIAAAVLFLALDNEYMSGKTLAVNGGI